MARFHIACQWCQRLVPFAVKILALGANGLAQESWICRHCADDFRYDEPDDKEE